MKLDDVVRACLKGGIFTDRQALEIGPLLAKTHAEGCDREDEDYPDCELCNTTMEKSEGDPCAFCSDCMYIVADVMARYIVLSSRA